MKQTALVVGASGIAGSNLTDKLIAQGWTTYGLARTPPTNKVGLQPVSADLLNPTALKNALAAISPTHVFFTTWLRQETEAENIRVNRQMVRNLLDVLSLKQSVQHMALVTGLKHYLGPFEAYGQKGFMPQTPLREEQPRLPIDNFYYAQEDELFAAAERDGFDWSVHRPHTIIGKADRNVMNLGTTLAVYATICRETNRLFRFPGSAAMWYGISDLTDARVLADHLIWASTTKFACDEAFNIVNGDSFRWSWLWQKLADWFGVDAAGYDGVVRPLQEALKGDGPLWKTIAQHHNLKETDLDQLASPWHTDIYLGRPIEVLTDMSKSRKLGFAVYQKTDESFYDLFTQLRAERLIP